MKYLVDISGYTGVHCATPYRSMVTETALQRCLAETFIERCHYFFPDLPETTPTNSASRMTPSSSITFTATSPSSSSSPTSLQSYTSKPFSQPAVSSEDLATPTPGVSSTPQKPKEDLPHPLADSALDEGVNVVLEGSSSPKLYQRASPTPSSSSEGGGVTGNSNPTPSTPVSSLSKTQSLPRSGGGPVPVPRTGSTTNLTPPESPSLGLKAPVPSPAPRTRHGTGSSSGGGEGGGGAADRLTEAAQQNGDGGGRAELSTSTGPPIR